MDRPTLERTVILRAGNRCEYCRMSQSLQGATFHLEHVVPVSRGGESDLENLALACPSCNLHKSDRLIAIDPETGESTPLFHPRRNKWDCHFQWDGFRLEGVTATGRATIECLHLNHPRRLRVREVERQVGLFEQTQSEENPGHSRGINPAV
jgi:hypothetical protein